MKPNLDHVVTPDNLPEEPWKYFKHDPEAILVPIHKLTPIRAREKGILNAKKYMWLAYQGQNDRRDPIHLEDLGDGSYNVLDGNSTYAVAVASGWSKIPGVVVATMKSQKAASVKYTGVFFPPSEVDKLHRWWNREISIPFLPYPPSNPHFTISFNPTARELSTLPVGSEATVKVIGWAADDMGQAVLVKGLPSRADYPHITISSGKPNFALYSNVLLANDRVMADGPTLKGVVGYFDGKPMFSPYTQEQSVHLAKTASYKFHFKFLVPIDNGEVEADINGRGYQLDWVVTKIWEVMDGTKVGGAPLEVKNLQAKFPTLEATFILNGFRPFNEIDVENYTQEVELNLMQAIRQTMRAPIGQWVFGQRVNPRDVELVIL